MGRGGTAEVAGKRLLDDGLIQCAGAEVKLAAGTGPDGSAAIRYDFTASFSSLELSRCKHAYLAHNAWLETPRIPYAITFDVKPLRLRIAKAFISQKHSDGSWEGGDALAFLIRSSSFDHTTIVYDDRENECSFYTHGVSDLRTRIRMPFNQFDHDGATLGIPLQVRGQAAGYRSSHRRRHLGLRGGDRFVADSRRGAR